MNSILYLSVNPFETRVALRENSRLVSYQAERHRTSSVVGNLYKGRVTRVLPGMQAAFVDAGLARDAFLYVREAGGILDDFTDIFPTEDDMDMPDASSSNIGDLLQQEQEVLVQVVKDPLGTKGARLTTHITLPGRFLVYLPTVRQRGPGARGSSTTSTGRTAGSSEPQGRTVELPKSRPTATTCSSYGDASRRVRSDRVRLPSSIAS